MWAELIVDVLPSRVMGLGIKCLEWNQRSTNFKYDSSSADC